MRIVYQCFKSPFWNLAHVTNTPALFFRYFVDMWFFHLGLGRLRIIIWIYISASNRQKRNTFACSKKNTIFYKKDSIGRKWILRKSKETFNVTASSEKFHWFWWRLLTWHQCMTLSPAILNIFSWKSFETLMCGCKMPRSVIFTLVRGLMKEESHFKICIFPILILFLFCESGSHF